MFYRLTAALALASIINACADEPPAAPFADGGVDFVRTALAPCDAAAGRMGAGLANLDRGASPVDAVHLARQAAGACRSAAVRIDGERARLNPRIHAACTAAGEMGETLGGLVESALDRLETPGALASMEEGVAAFRTMRAACEAGVS